MPKARDPFKVLEEAAKVAEPGYQNSEMMYQDFRNVFFGTPMGKRVFHQIMSWAGCMRSSYAKGDPYETHVKIGERNMGARIWEACIHEPSDRPSKQARRI